MIRKRYINYIKKFKSFQKLETRKGTCIGKANRTFITGEEQDENLNEP